MEIENPIEEARRYVANAEKIIQKANYDPELRSYTDSKYIKTAGNILWCGCLVALDAVLNVREGKGRPSIEKYKEAAGKRDRKLLHFLNRGYDTMHLVMGYDGNKGKKNVRQDLIGPTPSLNAASCSIRENSAHST